MTLIRILVGLAFVAWSAALGTLWAADAKVTAHTGDGPPAHAGTASDEESPAGSTAAAKADKPAPPAAAADAKATAKPEKPAVPAKQLFGAAKRPANLAARAIGGYSRGCLAGARALPIDGPAWQAMRLSRNRNWGHPDLIALVERLAKDAQRSDGWPGLLVGDIAQPRGGPMLTGHKSHQIGLDADIWLTPMPNRRLTEKEREDLSATSMLASDDISVDPKIWTSAHVALIKRAASFPEVERVLVHPAIKKALCEAAGPDRAWLGKVRPYWGHYYHFHMRMACPKGSGHCEHQAPVTGEDGCTKEIAEWIERVRPKPPPPPAPPGAKPPPRKPPPPPMTLERMPPECREVITAGDSGVPKPLLAKALHATVAEKTPKSAAAAHKPPTKSAEQN